MMAISAHVPPSAVVVLMWCLGVHHGGHQLVALGPQAEADQHHMDQQEAEEDRRQHRHGFPHAARLMNSRKPSPPAIANGLNCTQSSGKRLNIASVAAATEIAMVSE